MELSAKTAKVVFLVFVCMAASTTITWGIGQTTVNIALNSSSIAQGEVLHTFQNQSTYQIIHGQGCPQNTIDIGGPEGQSVVLQRTLVFENSSRPFCASPTTGAIAIQSYNCSIAIGGHLGISLMLNVVPTFFATAIRFLLASYDATVIEGLTNAPVSIRRHSELLAQTLPTPGLFLPQYRLSGNAMGVFRVYEQTAGCLSLPFFETTRSLNREMQNYWEIILEAYAPHAPTSLVASAVIRIQVLDINNTPPSIITSSGQARVHLNDNVLPGATVTQFQASDNDTGINAAVLFTTLNLTSHLTVHPLNGAVYLFRSVFPGQAANLSVELLAEDRGMPSLVSSPQSVQVFINQVNSTSPQLFIHDGVGGQNNQPPVVLETAHVGHQVATVELRDVENTAAITLQLENVGPCECFNLSNSVRGPSGITAEILVANELNFEEVLNGKYRLRLTAVNDDAALISLLVDVMVVDVNEGPGFSRDMYNYSVLEGIPVNTVISRILALDLDGGINGTISYTITTQSPASSLGVDQRSGIIRTTQEIDFEMTTTIDATIIAEDGGGLTAMTTISVNVMDRNDNPPIFTTASTNPTISKPETSNTDQVIFTFVAEDADSGCNGAVKYSIFNADPNVFRIDPSSGLLYPQNADSLDYEAFTSATIVVHATDLGDSVKFSADTTLHLQLEAVDDEIPVIDEVACPCFITENEPADSPDAQCPPLTAHDSDSSTLRFSIDPSFTYAGRFRIDPTNGVLSVVFPLDREERDLYEVGVVVTDENTNRSPPRIITVRVVDVNDESPAYNEVSRNIPVPTDLSAGKFVADLSATDADIGYNGIVIYNFTIETSAIVRDTFRLDPLSGMLFTKIQPTLTTYSFTVTATDFRSNNEVQLAVTLNVNGLKNNQPQFQVSVDHRTVCEDLAVNSDVARFSAMDSDQVSNGQLTYSVVGSSSNHSEFFTLQTDGRLILTQSLSGRAGSIYVVNVSATDGGTPSLSDYQLLIVRVYAREYFLNSQRLVYNPDIPACHYARSINEGSDTDNVVVDLSTIQLVDLTVHYTALDGPDSSAPFTIVASNLRVMSGFGSSFNNTEAIFITVLGQYGSNFYLCSVTIAVDDINNNPPYFSRSSYSFEVYSGIPEGSTVATIQALDDDFARGNSMVVYSANNQNVPFQIDINTGVISVSGSLVPSQDYTFSITAVDPGFPSVTATATVTIFVLNVPNSAPAISETSIVYSEILNSTLLPQQLSISDADGNMNSQSIDNFCIASGNLLNSFTVNNQGMLRPLRLDFESATNYNLTVMAYDSSLNPMHSTASVRIQVLDENEHPMFSVPVYNASLLEGASAGSEVITVSATDRDADRNGDITYSVSVDEPFTITARTGLITSERSFTNTDMLSFTVTATDGGTPPQSCTAEVHVYIVDVNNNRPMFSMTSATAEVPENVEIGYEVYRVAEKTSDSDRGANGAIRYAIDSGNQDAKFAIDPWTGIVMTTQKLDYETAPNQYTLTIVAEDLGNQLMQRSLQRLSLTIQVTNVNDNFPTFSAAVYECSITERQNVFQTPCQVSATDMDEDVIVYSLIPSISTPFEIDASNGRVTARPVVELDVLSEPEYIFQVQASDSVNAAVSILRIEIIDDNDIPARLQIENATYYIYEGIPVNTLLFFAHYHDLDASQSFSSVMYGKLNDPSSDPSRVFSVDEETGAVFLTEPLDYEMQTSALQLRVTGGNAMGGSHPSTYTIHILDSKDDEMEPVFDPVLNPKVFWVERGLPTGSFILALNATSAKPVTYGLIGGTGISYFQIDPTSGILTTLLPLTAVETSTLTLMVRALEGVGVHSLQSFHELTLTLSDSITTRPVFDYPVFFASPSENAPLGLLHTVRATVGGVTDSIVYGISGGNEQDTFTIDSSTGAVSLSPSGVLNRENKDLYNITITASRPGTSGTSSALLVVAVEDADDFRPTLADIFNFTVFSNFPVGPREPMARIFVEDRDLGDNRNVSYALQTPSSPFSISSRTGHIYLTESLPDTPNHYDLTVIATGQTFDPAQLNFRISVLPTPAVPPNPTPNFNNLNLAENTMQNTPIGRITLSQPSPFPVIFRIQDQSAKVSILPNSGEIYLTGVLDYETEQSIAFMVDILNGVSMRSITLHIAIGDENDNRPQFSSSSYHFTVSEAQLEPDRSIDFVQATDDDSLAITTLTYSIVDASVAGLFEIDSTTGTIKLSSNPSSIDREILPVHRLTISVSDGGSPPLLDFATVTIAITDADDNNPVFRPSSLTIYIPEDTDVGQVIHMAIAFDPDLGSASSVSYELVTTSNVPFVVNSSTGEVITSSQLDTESQDVYEVLVRVLDPTNQSYSGGILNLTVIIQDVLDSGPLLFGPTTASIRENYPPYSKVAQIQSEFQERLVYYTLVDGNQLDRFLVESVTGTVRTTTALDRESIGSYVLVIQGAYALGYESNFTLIVNVSDVNDVKPTFPSLFIEFNVPENSRPLEPLGNVNVNTYNQDVALNFAIMDSFAASIFQVTSDGNLELRQDQILDRENRFASLMFELYVVSKGTLDQFSTALVRVVITDVNDPPMFSQTVYSYIISTPLLVGAPQFAVLASDEDDGVNGDLTYSLLGQPSSVFSIDPASGYISVIDISMLQDQYSLSVVARDGGGLEASANVNVSFSACNFRNLTFTPSSKRVEVSVRENATEGHVLIPGGLLRVLDLSRETGSMLADVRFSFLQNVSNFFDLNSNTGEITVVRLNREMRSEYLLVVQATDRSDSSRIAHALVIVTVLDANDNAPVFSQSQYSHIVTEEDLVVTNFTYVALPVVAMDADVGTNAAVTYRLTQPSNLFRVNPTSGFITLSAPPELVEVGTTFQFAVEAIDGGDPPLSSTTTVTITVVNSRAPRFTQQVYSIEVPESTPSNTPILNITLDSSADTGPISLRFLGGSFNVPFSISSSGVVTVVDPRLDYETQQRYNLTLRARNQDGLEGFSTLLVTVLDTNDVVPSFMESGGLYIQSVSENLTAGSVVLTVTANDADSLPNAQISYSLNTNNTNLFVIDQMGRISLNGELDFEADRTYEYEVYAQDSGNPPLTGTAVVRFLVVNVNDNPPMFQQPFYITSVQETDRAGATELFVAASDADNLDAISYGIVDGPGSSDFSISQNGRLNLETVVNSNLTEYVLNVSAFDGMFYGYTLVRVTIEGVNAHSPVFNSTSYTLTVQENSSPGVFLTQVFATDADRGSNGEVSYSLEDNGGFFAINSSTGVITTSSNAENIDRERNPPTSLLVIASDGGRSNLTQVSVTVEDINDNRPMFVQSVFVGFTPDNADNDNVVVVRATDNDIGINAELTYSIVNFDFALPFRIQSDTGVVYTFVRPQLDSQANYQFNVTVRDNGSPPEMAPSIALVNIAITENSQSMVAFEESTYMTTISEDASLGDTVFPRIAVNTANNTIRCQAITQAPVPPIVPFILVNDLELRVAPTLNFGNIMPGNYTLFVTADCVLPGNIESQAIAQIMVRVEPVNDPPDIEELVYRATISERNTSNPEIVRLDSNIRATDNDSPDTPEGTIRYSLLNHNSLFSLGTETAILIVMGPLDFEMTQSYELFIEAYDLGSPSMTSQVSSIVINVADVDDHPPSFNMAEYVVEVFENRSVGDLIFEPNVTDVDTVSTHSFTISGSIFSIDRNSGEIRLLQQLDREQSTNHTATITVADAAGSAEATLRVLVLDVNDNAPVFTPPTYSVTVPENFPTSTSFTQVFATDADEGENAEIVFKPGDSFTESVANIDNTTGEIYFTRSPDYEESEQFTLHVFASNPLGDATGFASVVVTLQDVNDNAPRFPQPSYTASIRENRPSGSVVTIDNVNRVEAMDPDSGDGGRISYSVAGTAAELFSVTADGDLQSLTMFNREANDFYDLVVVATDMGSPPMSANVSFRVVITDQNDNSPVFPQSSYSVNVPENTPIGTPIFNVAAVDADSGPNSEIGHYSLSGTFNTDFEATLNPNGSVTISVARELNFEVEQKQRYQLTITATDNGFTDGFSRDGSMSLTVFVTDVDDNLPMFTMRTYTASIAENAAVGTHVVTVVAEDRDAGGTSQLLYSIRNANNTHEIGIVENNGTLVVLDSLDYEVRDFYSLVIIVEGGIEDAVVEITVLDVNDNAPVFPNSTYSVSIMENNSPGASLRMLRATDVDSQDDLITYSIVAGNIDDRFELVSLGVMGVNVLVTKPLDREDRSLYSLVIAADDRDTPSLSSNTTLQVEVLDVNDNSPVGGHQSIFVFPLFGRTPEISLGEVFVNDSDSDAVNSHTYSLLPGVGSDNILIQNDGSIRVNTQNPIPGTYFFVVSVRDQDNTPANTTISAHIRNVSQDTLDKSFTLQLSGTTPQAFVDNNFATFVNSSTTILRSQLGVEVDVQVISVQQATSSSPNVDVSLAVLNKTSSLYITPLIVQHTLHVNRTDLPGVTVVTESVDQCSQELCATGTSCLNAHQYSIGAMALGSRSITYLGVSDAHTQTCVPFLASLCSGKCSSASSCYISANKEGTVSATCISSCSSQPCRNGGTCEELASGYFCQCPEGYEGRNCEQTTASFVRTSYAIFPSLQGYTAGFISFEFNAGANSDSQLLYAGRFDTAANDHIRVTFESNQVCVRVSYGGEEKRGCVKAWDVLSDGQWHRVAITYNPMEVKITVLDPSFTEVETVITDFTKHSLDVNSPVYIGQVPNGVRGNFLPGYTGCLRNVLVNGEVLDFSSPLLTFDVRACISIGCSLMPCKNRGTCFDDGRCDCPVQFSGPTCDQESSQVTFLGEDFIQYEVITGESGTVAKRQVQNAAMFVSDTNTITFSFITTEPSGAIIQIGDHNREYMIAEISEGYVQVRYNLGDGAKVLRVSSVVVTDAEPRTVVITRTLGSVEIVVNNTHVARNSSPLATGNNTTLSVLAEQLYLGAEVNVTTGGVVRGFIGCLQGIKLDREELPLTSSGSMSFRVLKFPPGGTISGCPLLNVREREQPDEYVYAGLGAIIGGTLLISFVFVITCSIVGFCWRKKNGSYDPNTSTPGSPLHMGGGFKWEPAHEVRDQKLRSNEELELQATNFMTGHVRSLSNQSQQGESTNHFFRSDSTFQKPPHLTSVEIEPNHIRQDSRQSGRSLVVPYPPEGFSAINQENPGYRSSPTGSDEEDGAGRTLHVRPSSGHFSVRSDASSKNFNSSGGGELQTALGVRKRVEMANADLEEVGFDEVKPYSDEGPYEPLGSIGSLYDILLESRTAPVNVSTPGLTYEPSAALPIKKVEAAPNTRVIGMKRQPPKMPPAPQQQGQVFAAPQQPPPPPPQAPLPQQPGHAPAMSQQPADYSTPMKTLGESSASQGPPQQLTDNRQNSQNPPLHKAQGRRSKRGKSTKTNPLSLPPPPPPPPPPQEQHTPEKTNPLLYDAQHTNYHSDLGKVSHQHQTKVPDVGKGSHQHQTQVPDVGKGSHQHQTQVPLPLQHSSSINTDKQPGKKWEVSIFHDEEEVAPEQMGSSKQSQRMRRSARRSGRHVGNRSVENILDKFHNITIAGGLSQDSKEVTKVL